MNLTETKHTPGPWEINTLASAIDGEEDIVIEHYGCPIVTVRGTNDMSCIDEEDLDKINDEVIATAKLIAAAPDMIEAFSRITNCNDLATAQEYARQAIQKATS